MPLIAQALPPLLARPRATLPLLILASLLIVGWRMLAFSYSGATLYVDEAQYWLWSRDLDWGYFSKPPGIAVLIRASTQLFGDDALGVKLLCMLCYPASAWVGRACAIRLYDTATGNWVFAALLSLPMYAWLGLFVSTDGPLILCWALALHIYLHAREQSRLGPWLWLGAICGLGLLFKYSMAAFLPGMLLHLAITPGRRLRQTGPWLTLIVTGLIILPNLGWNLAHDFPTLRHTADITLARQTQHGLADLLGFIAAQWAGLGFLLGVLLIAALIPAFKSLRQAGPGQLLLCFCLPLWALACIQAARGGANANWAAPALLPACLLLVAYACQQGRQRLLLWGIALNLALTALAYHAPQWLRALPPSYAKLNPFQRASGWDALAAQIRPLLSARPNTPLLADNRTLLAHFAYELRDLSPGLAAWQSGERPGDHFQLRYPLAQQAATNFLYLGEAEPPPALRAQFRQLEKLAELNGSGPRPLFAYLLNERKTD